MSEPWMKKRRSNSCFSLALVSCSLLLAGTASAAPFRVCGITLNSSDEFNAFRTIFRGPGVEFEELTASADPGVPNDVSWWNTACATAKPCDVVVLSGHFAGDFFGDEQRAKLPLRTLERSACANDCGSILRSPGEVYLFGCNTLSDKSRDRRTDEEYRVALRRHGFDAGQSDEILEHRYGEFGAAYGDRLRSVFSSTSRLYGFSSIAPLGHDSGPRLLRALGREADLPARVRSDRARVMAGMPLIPNLPLLEEFRGTSLTESFPVKSGARSASFCALDRTDRTRDEVRIEIQSVLEGDRLMEALPLVLDLYFERGLDSVPATDWNFRMGSDAVHSRLRAMLSDLARSSLGVRLRAMLYALGGMNDFDFRASVVQYAHSLLGSGPSAEAADRICSLPPSAMHALQPADFPASDSFLITPAGASILSCLNFTTAPRFYDRAVALLESTRSPDLRKRLLWGVAAVASRALYAPGERVRTDHRLTTDEHAINRAVIQNYRANPDVSSILYSFIPGRDLTSAEHAFIAEILVHGPQAFNGWEYSRLVRVAAASNIRDAAVTEVVRHHRNHPRVSSAAAEYFAISEARP